MILWIGAKAKSDFALKFSTGSSAISCVVLFIKQKENIFSWDKICHYFEEIHHQIDLEKYENVSRGLLNDSIVENLENIANSAHNWAVKILCQLPR